MKKGKQGFLLVQAIFFIIISSMVSIAMARIIGANAEIKKIENTKTKMNIIRKKLNNYYMVNNRIPCPTKLTNNTSNINYGREEACSNTTYSIGGIPFITLGLPEQYTYDGWGKKIVFISTVNTNCQYTCTINRMMRENTEYYDINYHNEGISTTIGYCNCAIFQNIDTTQPQIFITDNNGADSTNGQNTGYLILSHGHRGVGGYDNRGIITTPCNEDTAEKTNCILDNIFLNANFSLAMDSKYYDDILLWETEYNLKNSSKKYINIRYIDKYSPVFINKIITGNEIGYIINTSGAYLITTAQRQQLTPYLNINDQMVIQNNILLKVTNDKNIIFLRKMYDNDVVHLIGVGDFQLTDGIWKYLWREHDGVIVDDWVTNGTVTLGFPGMYLARSANLRCTPAGNLIRNGLIYFNEYNSCFPAHRVPSEKDYVFLKKQGLMYYNGTNWIMLPRSGKNPGAQGPP